MSMPSFALMVVNLMFSMYVYSESNRYDCVLIASMRKMQQWSFVSIIGEFRLLSGPERYFDLEQFIESFEPDSMELLTHVTKGSVYLPEFMTVEYHVRVIIFYRTDNILSWNSMFIHVYLFF